MAGPSILAELFMGFEIVIIAASILLNLILICLIIFRSSREIGAYRYLLLAFTLNNIYYPVVHLLTLPVTCTYKDAFIMFSHGLLTSRLSITFFASSHSHTMPLLAHLFTYRLLAAKWPNLLRFYTPLKCYFLVSITVAVEGAIWFFNVYFGYESDQEMRDYIQPLLDAELDGDGTEFIGALYYSPNGNHRTRSIIATMVLNALMLFFLTIIIACSFAIVSHYRQIHTELSGKTRKMQRQLFYILVAQLIFPLVFVYLPCGAIINMPMLGVHVYVHRRLTSASFAVFPLIDACIIMFGVRSYRHALQVILSNRGVRQCHNISVHPKDSANRQNTARAVSSHH